MRDDTVEKEGTWEELDDLRRRARDEDWLIDVEASCSFERSLGKGSSGEAFLARWRGARVVVKRIEALKTTLAKRAFARECAIMARVRHPNVLAFYGAALSESRCDIVVEHAAGGTLKAWLHESGRQKRSLSERLDVGLDVARAFAYLESRTPSVMHRYLKPSNVFVGMDGRAMVADFGLSRFVAANGEELTGETGTYIYMAPEVIRSENYDNRADVFSYGVLLHELVTGIEPYQPHNSTAIQIATAVADQGLRPNIPKDTHAGLAAIIEMCWQQNASDRPSFAAVLESMETMVPDILKEQEAKAAARRENPSVQAKAFQNLSHTFATWSSKMAELGGGL